MKSVLVQPQILALTKQKDNQMMIDFRFSIVTCFFEMIYRVETKIKKTVKECLKTLIKLENQAKEIVSNEDKFKQILKPVISCLQQSFDKFNPNFLSMFKSLLKLISIVFNKSLSDKLIDNLQ